MAAVVIASCTVEIWATTPLPEDKYQRAEREKNDLKMLKKQIEDMNEKCTKLSNLAEDISTSAGILVVQVKKY
jgi:hypothetical protein